MHTPATRYAYLFLVERARYLNHQYLFGLISLTLFCGGTASTRYLSVDEWLRGRQFGRRARGGKSETLSLRPRTAPYWPTFVLCALLWIVYTYAGLTKISWDWVVRGEPMRSILRARAPKTLPAAYVWIMDNEVAAYVTSAGGLVLDLFFGTAAWRAGPARVVFLLLAVAFHVSNAIMLPSIGSFPFVMIAANLVFLEPSTVARFSSLLAPADGSGAVRDTRKLPAGQGWTTREAVVAAAVITFLLFMAGA